VVLLDVSGSMSVYSQYFLNFVRGNGCDTDSPGGALAVELRQLKRRAHRLVWLNPPLGWKGYSPVARAMAGALGHVDCFATAHSPASLAALEDQLARL
jgi:uncharacterized protein with von Willebrand factor type A (vWA) domain